MALMKQLFDVLFTKGINSKTDSKLTLNASLLALKNAVFTKFGVINKRNGFIDLGSEDCNGTSLTDIKSVMTSKDELLMVSGLNHKDLKCTNKLQN